MNLDVKGHASVMCILYGKPHSPGKRYMKCHYDRKLNFIRVFF